MNDKRIYDIYVAGRGSSVLAVAVRLDLFALLDERARTEAEIAADLRLSARGTASMCRALVGLSLLQREGDVLRPSPDAASYLVPGRPGYLGGLIDMEFDTFMSPTALLAAVQQGRAGVYGESGMWEVHAEDPERTSRFAQMMTSISATPAAALARTHDFSGHTHLLDVGGGAGVFVEAVLTAHPHMHATLYDIPAVRPLVESRMAAAGLTERCRIVAGDMFTESWPDGADVLLLSQILHDWTPNQCADLLACAHRALDPGGTVLIHEKLIDADGGPAANALVDLDMLFWTEGQQLTIPQAHQLLQGAGFGAVTVTPTVGYWSVAAGRKDPAQ